MKHVLIINNLNETKRLGISIGNMAVENTVIALSGDLGAGKTTLTQSIAKGLQVSTTVNSPTFTICKIYEGRLPLYHFDAYRLENSNEDLGFEEMIDGDGLAVIEWAEFIDYMLPKDYLKITIKILDNESREMTFEAFGDKSTKLLEEIL